MFGELFVVIFKMKFMIYRYTFSFLVSILFLGCKAEKEEEISPLCNNQKYLLAPNKELPTFNFDLNINPKEHIRILKDSLKLDDLCDISIVFNKQFKDRIIELNIQALCNFRGQANFQTIDLNYTNKMLYETGLINPDSIAYYLEKDFPFLNNQNKISFSWPYGLSNPIIEDVIYNSSNGYLNALNTISKKKYQISVCELNKETLYKLKKEYPITLLLFNYRGEIENEYFISSLINEDE